MAAFLACVGTCAPRTGLEAAENQPALELRDGDRVVLLGGAFVERMQSGGYLETWLTASTPGRNVAFRNLGWSGDTVTGIARAVFGSPADGFARLERDVRAAKPTVILVGYGANEAYAGTSGLADFQASLNRLLDTLQTTGARLVLLSPHRRLKLPPPLPDPEAYNRDLSLYSDVLRAEARRRDLPFVDLSDVLEMPPHAGPAFETFQPSSLTENGLHPSPMGYWFAAPRVAQRLGIRGTDWNVQLTLDGLRVETAGCDVRDVKVTDTGVQWQITDKQLNYPPAPTTGRDDPVVTHPLVPAGKLAVRGLPAGTYQLLIDQRPVVAAQSGKWAEGVELPRRGDDEQVERLRLAIRAKNELYFHHYRPQNETYLFLFRKHEQGNNAVEIAQLEPLIAEADQAIQKAATPLPRHYQLRRLPDPRDE